MVDPRACRSRGRRSQTEVSLSGGSAPLQKGLTVSLDPAIGAHVPSGASLFVSAILGERLSVPPTESFSLQERQPDTAPSTGPGVLCCWVLRRNGQWRLDGNVVWSALLCPAIPPLTSFEVQDPPFTLSAHIQAGVRTTAVRPAGANAGITGPSSPAGSQLTPVQGDSEVGIHSPAAGGPQTACWRPVAPGECGRPVFGSPASVSRSPASFLAMSWC